MRLPTLVAGLALASSLLAAGEPEWCEVEKNAPMERRGIGCLEACTMWRDAQGMKIVEPTCPPENYQYHTFEDAEYQGEAIVCIVKVECVKSGGR